MSGVLQQQVREIEPQKTVKFIPAAVNIFDTETTVQKSVCAYCRVSTDQCDQQSSYELQVGYYTELINQNEHWKFSGVYADEGISGTSTKHRTSFMNMIEDCKLGKIDLIITKSISRFARNTLDCLNYVRLLKTLPSPVGVYFEKENINTLDSSSELLLAILSSLAQDESRNISENIRWALQKQYQQGNVHCQATYLLGYDADESGNLIINEEQAKTIRRIYCEFIRGEKIAQIAQRLTAEKIRTGKGYQVWRSNTVYQILRNEKYCGDVLTHKRITPDFLTHKIQINKGQQPQYYISNHHPYIIPKDEWNLVQHKLNQRSRTQLENN